MKRLITLILLFNTLLLSPALASHLIGGEITWECLGSGQFQFYLKLYRDCNGIQLGSGPYTLHIIGGGSNISSVTVNQISVNDITPPGCGNTCNNPNGFLGATEEHIYRSNPVILSGIPPLTGWTIYWDGECCRNCPYENVTNCVNTVIRSKMFSFNSNNTNPCYDSSPVFTEKPLSFICIGYPVTYNPAGTDNDLDSLVYSFDYALDNGGTGNAVTAASIMPFVAPYSVTVPLPGNPVIDPTTGAISFFPPSSFAQQGNYLFVTKVTSYRCNQKMAEVFREIQISIAGGGCGGACDGTGNNQNDPPTITPAPFQNAVSGLYTDYADTVLVGDTISFNLNVFEFETHLPGCAVPQSFWINMSGAQLDSGSITPFFDCELPPCAYINHPLPGGPYTIGHAINFTWIPGCDHVSNECSEYNSYFFEINAKDDACPAPARSSKTFEVVIRGLHVVANGDTLSVNTPYSNLQWYLNGVLIPGATDDTLITSSSSGSYTVQAVTPAGCSIESNRIGIVHVGSNEISSTSNNLTLYPNPVSGVLHVEIKSEVTEATQLKITDGLGRELKHEVLQLNPGRNSFDVATNDLQNGIYYLSVKGKENICSKRIIVMH